LWEEIILKIPRKSDPNVWGMNEVSDVDENKYQKLFGVVL